MKKRFKIGDEVLINEDNEQYGDALGKILIVEKISTNTKQHPGCDSGVGEALYDLKFKNGKQFNSSLYDYELRHAKMNRGTNAIIVATTTIDATTIKNVLSFCVNVINFIFRTLF